MEKYRKLILGIAFLICATVISVVGIKEGVELIGLGTVIGAIAGGVFGVIYGNIKEHEAKSDAAPKT